MTGINQIMTMDNDEIIEGSGSEIHEQLVRAGVPAETAQKIQARGASLTDKVGHTYKCTRTRVLCEDANPGSTTGKKYGFTVTCHVTYDDGSSDTIVEDYGC